MSVSFPAALCALVACGYGHLMPLTITRALWCVYLRLCDWIGHEVDRATDRGGYQQPERSEAEQADLEDWASRSW